MTLEEFVAMVERDRPDELATELVADVKPHPWVTRHGSGKRARIRMKIGGAVKYERRQSDEIWKRVEDWTMGEPL